MKIRCLLPIALLLVLLAPCASLAEGETGAAGSPTPDASAAAEAGAPATGDDTAGTVSFTIDDANVYAGMPKAYQDGYVPQVKKGVATIVLPLVASGEVAGNAVTVTLGLGDVSAGPFVIKNYQKTVPLAANAVNGGPAAVSSYLVRFDLKLRSGRVDGAYPVTIAVDAKTKAGTPVQQTFTTYVTITDGKDPNVTQTPPTEPPAAPQPKILVNSYTLEPAAVTAGSEFALKVQLKNTSDTEAVRNITVAVSCESADFMLLNDSNTLYLSEIEAGGTSELLLKYKTGLKTPAQRYTIALAMEYEDMKAAAHTSSGAVSVAVAQQLRLKLEAPKIAGEVNAGDTLPLSFQVMNLGRGAVYNVRCEVVAAGLFPLGTAFIGNMEGGTAKTAETDVFVGTKDMTEGYKGDDKYGPTDGKLRLIYEDDEGKEYVEETDFFTTILEPVIAPALAEDEETPRKAAQWWVSVLIGLAAVAVLAAALVYRGRRKAKRP